MEPSRILVIDDERVICDGCRLVLAPLGYSVEFALDGHTGLEATRSRPFDLILLDMKLPDIDGMEILKSVCQEKPDLSVVIMTGYFTVENAVAAMKLGADDYLTKPFTDDAIVFAVQRALEKRRLVTENRFLRKELSDRYRFDKIVGETPRILEIFSQIQKVAPEESTVLLYGESGTGKELFARAIHSHSRRAARQFVAVDCSTLTPSLLESELFGHVKGAFTGAVEEKAGIFEMAEDGTLFLDDIANLGMEIQGKLLRVLEACEYKPVGASHIKKTNVRVIAATNRDIKMMVDEGTFREDLFYRLNVFSILIPPLRERKDDIPRLAYHFLKHFRKKTGKKLDGFSDEAMETLVNYGWPGNVRQLKNVIERLVIMAENSVLNGFDLLEAPPMGASLKGDAVPDTLDGLKHYKDKVLKEHYLHMEKAFLLKALKKSAGNISQAAETVGMQRSNFSTMMKAHQLSATPKKE
jgi:DNA-binding NtrC family response regulator